jgi:uncharacterized RDD family membrane protein YckC
MPPPPGGSFVPPPPAYQGATPPGYQAYSPSPVGNAERAGFGSRLGGHLLDSLLYGLLFLAIAIPAFLLIAFAFDDCISVGDEVCAVGEVNGGSLAGGIVLLIVGFLLVVALYIRALGTTGQTWGRKLAGVKVVGEMTGQPIGVGKALGRQLFANFISGQIFSLGYLWMLWDDKKQTWHDKVVGSIVIKV